MEFCVTITEREEAELLPIIARKHPLGADEVAGRTLASLISAGTELAGAYLGEHFPQTPGYAAVFEVEAVGADVAGLKVGDLAFCMGGHRSHQRLPARDAVPVPAGLSAEQATFARIMGVSMAALSTTAVRPPAKVLVIGLGLVGHLAAKIFDACGYRVTACDLIEERRVLLLEAGFADVLPAVNVEDVGDDGGFDLVLECSGHEEAARAGCRTVRKGGEVVLVGVPWRQRSDVPAFDVLHAVFHRYAVLRSGWEWELPHHPAEFRRGSIHGNYATALRWLAGGRVGVGGLYKRLPPREIQSAYQDLLHRRCNRLGVVLDWTDCP